MKLSPEYLAGFFDGEGSIVIGKRTLTLANGVKSPWYVMVTCLVNTYLPILIETRSMFERGKKRVYSGHGATRKPRNKSQRNCYMWHAASDVAEEFLRYMRPHMIVKAAEADLAFEFRDHVRKYRHSHMRARDRADWLTSDLYKQIQAERHEMYLKMKALKKVAFLGSDGIAMNSEEVLTHTSGRIIPSQAESL